MYLGNGVKIHDWDLREILNEKRKRLLKRFGAEDVVLWEIYVFNDCGKNNVLE